MALDWEKLIRRQKEKDAQQESDDIATKAILADMAKQLEKSRLEAKRMAEAAALEKQQALAFKWVYHDGKYVASYSAYYEWVSMGNTHHCPKCKQPFPNEIVQWQPMMETDNLIRVHTRCGAKMVLE